MTAKEYLQQVRTIDVKIRQLKEQLFELTTLMQSPGGVKYDKPPGNEKSNKSVLEKNVIKKMELEREITEQLNDSKGKKAETTLVIQQLDNVNYVQVLYKRYVELKSYRKIAEEMGYSVQNIFKLHQAALEAFDEKVE